MRGAVSGPAICQLTYRESLRDIEACPGAVGPKLYHMGLGVAVARSTLADGNESGWRIFADFAHVLIRTAIKLYANGQVRDLYALDSTIIDLCPALFPWARFRRHKAAVKMLTLLDLSGSIPTFICITDGRVHDVKFRHAGHDDPKNAELALLQSEQQMQRMMDTVPSIRSSANFGSMLWSMASDGSVTSINRKVRDYTGLSVDQIRSGEWPEMIPPEEGDEVARERQEALTNGGQYEAEHRIRRADATWLTWSKTQSASSGRTQTVGAFRLITTSWNPFLWPPQIAFRSDSHHQLGWK